MLAGLRELQVLGDGQQRARSLTKDALACGPPFVYGRNTHLDEERANVGDDEHYSDALRTDEEVLVRLEVPREPAQEHVLGCDERAWLAGPR